MPPIRLDPTQRIVDFSFGNRIAIIYAYAGRANAFVPPQLHLSLTAPVSFTLINGDAVLDPTGSVGEDVTADMLQSYRAWRYRSVEVYSDGHADLVGIHCAIGLNLGKFADGPPVIPISLTAASMGGEFTPPEVVLSTHRSLGRVILLTEGSGNVVTDADPVGHKVAMRDTPGTMTGTIDLRTLAVTLVGGGSSGGSGGGGGSEG